MEIPSQVVAMQWDEKEGRWRVELLIEERESTTLGRLIGTRRGLNVVLTAKE